MDLVLDAPARSTTDEILEQALALPSRSITTWSESELGADHPFRKLLFDTAR
jgi:hypothetical protein